MGEEIRFIRKNGRIIPVKVKKGQNAIREKGKKTPTPAHHNPYRAGASLKEGKRLLDIQNKFRSGGGKNQLVMRMKIRDRSVGTRFKESGIAGAKLGATVGGILGAGMGAAHGLQSGGVRGAVAGAIGGAVGGGAALGLQTGLLSGALDAAFGSRKAASFQFGVVKGKAKFKKRSTK